MGMAVDIVTSFFSDPWNYPMTYWTLKHVFSAAVQLGAGYIVLQFANVFLGEWIKR